MSQTDPEEDEVMVLLEVSEDLTEYKLTVKSAQGSPLDDKDFIVHVEMWLHEVAQAETTRSKSGEYLH